MANIEVTITDFLILLKIKIWYTNNTHKIPNDAATAFSSAKAIMFEGPQKQILRIVRRYFMLS